MYFIKLKLSLRYLVFLPSWTCLKKKKLSIHMPVIIGLPLVNVCVHVSMCMCYSCLCFLRNTITLLSLSFPEQSISTCWEKTMPFLTIFSYPHVLHFIFFTLFSSLVPILPSRWSSSSSQVTPLLISCL